MDAAQSEALGEFLSNLHTENFAKVKAQPALKKFSMFKESAATRARLGIFYYEGSDQVLRRQLSSFAIAPRSGEHTPYVIVDIDTRNSWLKLFRFVGNDQGELNAEAVCLWVDNKIINGFGYRYEHPENFHDNKHGFFHVQPILANSKDVPIPGGISWLPVNFPTFYMFASCAYELALFSIHSMSGWEKLQDYKVKYKDSNDVLKMLVRVGEFSKVPFPFAV